MGHPSPYQFRKHDELSIGVDEFEIFEGSGKVGSRRQFLIYVVLSALLIVSSVTDDVIANSLEWSVSVNFGFMDRIGRKL